jgi:hypothetical protein
MPFDKRIKKVPDIFKIYNRQRMGANAATEELTKETYININFPSEKGAVDWIKNTKDHGKIFVIRNRKDEMIDSYGWSANKSVWNKINKSGYYGGYKIGKPLATPYFICDCFGQCKDPDHPSIKKPL